MVTGTRLHVTLYSHCLSCQVLRWPFHAVGKPISSVRYEFWGFHGSVTLTVFWHVEIPGDGGSRIYPNVDTVPLYQTTWCHKPQDQIIITANLFFPNFAILQNKSHLIVIPLGLLSYHISKFSISQYSNSISTKDSSVFSLAQAVQIIISVAILFTYALQMYVPVELLWPKIQRRWGPFKHNTLIEILFRSSLVVLTCKCIIQLSGTHIMGVTQLYDPHKMCYIVLCSP